MAADLSMTMILNIVVALLFGFVANIVLVWHFSRRVTKGLNSSPLMRMLLQMLPALIAKTFLGFEKEFCVIIVLGGSAGQVVGRQLRVIGLTGGIAVGKSTVSELLQKNGCKIIDADKIAKQVVEPGKSAYKKIVAAFGDEILQEDMTINREKLGSIIFSDAEKRKQLNAATHPAITWEILCQTWKLRKEPLVVLDAPLLFETGRWGLVMLCFPVILVDTPSDIQCARLMKRNGLNKGEAEKRISSQMSLEKKRELAKATNGSEDFHLSNSKDLAHLETQVKKVIEKLKAMAISPAAANKQKKEKEKDKKATIHGADAAQQKKSK
jgi:dephospho-CoA kinase